MKNERKPNLDERLADFTDRLMAGEAADKAAASDADRELASLQETVEKAWRNLRAPQPDSAMRNRIRSGLAAEWLEKGPQAQGKKKGWISPREKNRIFLLRLTAVVAILGIAALVVAPKIDMYLTGATQSKGGVILIGGIVVAVLVLILLWPSRKP